MDKEKRLKELELKYAEISALEAFQKEVFILAEKVFVNMAAQFRRTEDPTKDAIGYSMAFVKYRTQCFKEFSDAKRKIVDEQLEVQR